MPVTLLYVEGGLDEQLLVAVLGGAPAVKRAGSKYALQGIVLREREKTDDDSIYFLRDRDFDFEPADAGRHVPEPMITHRDGQLVGWRWLRHCIECYLLEPALAAAALDRPQVELENYLQAAGRDISNYQAARWAIGQVRLRLPPSRHLETHPPQLGNEFTLPIDISEEANWNWILTSTREFIQPVTTAFHENALRQSFDHYATSLSDLDIPNILVWFSGKDLLTSIAPRIGNESPAQIRNRIRDWVLDHPAEALGFLPEWASLRPLFAR